MKRRRITWRMYANWLGVSVINRRNDSADDIKLSIVLEIVLGALYDHHMNEFKMNWKQIYSETYAGFRATKLPIWTYQTGADACLWRDWRIHMQQAQAVEQQAFSKQKGEANKYGNIFRTLLAPGATSSTMSFFDLLESLLQSSNSTRIEAEVSLYSHSIPFMGYSSASIVSVRFLSGLSSCLRTSSRPSKEHPKNMFEWVRDFMEIFICESKRSRSLRLSCFADMPWGVRMVSGRRYLQCWRSKKHTNARLRFSMHLMLNIIFFWGTRFVMVTLLLMDDITLPHSLNIDSLCIFFAFFINQWIHSFIFLSISLSHK